MGAADWPEHDNKAWQKVIDLAHEMGWPKPHWTTNHPTLILRCPAGEKSCTITAFSTGTGTESVAISSLRKVRRCPHRDIKQPLAKIDEALRSADRLISGAEMLISRGAAADRIEELLELASGAVGEAASAIEAEFETTDLRMEQLTAEADTLLEGDSSSIFAGDVVHTASEHLKVARTTLKPLPPRAPDVVERQERLASLVARRDRARA